MFFISYYAYPRGGHTSDKMVQLLCLSLGISILTLAVLSVFTLSVMAKCSLLRVSGWCTHNGQENECGMTLLALIGCHFGYS